MQHGAADFEIVSKRDRTNLHGIEANIATMTAGLCDLATVGMSLDDLAKVKAMIQEAKTRLDDIR